jgi:hypothetical protein
MSDLIISIAVDGRDKYSEIVKGLEQSINKSNWQGDVRIYKEFPAWCMPHDEIPYKFKYDLIHTAMMDGYEKIFWLDSTIRLLPDKNIHDLFKYVRYGLVAFHNLGHETYKYITDKAVENLECESYLMQVKNTWGGAIGFDFTNKIPTYIFYEMLRQANAGSFDNGISKREGFVAARHDQSVLAVLLHKYEIELLPYGMIASKNDITSNSYLQYGD